MRQGVTATGKCMTELTWEEFRNLVDRMYNEPVEIGDTVLFKKYEEIKDEPSKGS